MTELQHGTLNYSGLYRLLLLWAIKYATEAEYET